MLSAEETAEALRTKMQTPYAFRCEHQENDGSISGLDDVDYFCEPVESDGVGYWVATNGDEITGTQQTGP